MPIKPPHIRRHKNGRYYARFYVPSDLIRRFGRSEFTRSLETSRLNDAKGLLSFLCYGWRLTGETARKDIMLTSTDLQNLAKKHFTQAIAQAESDRLARKLRRGELEHVITEHVEIKERLQDWLSRNQLSQVIDTVSEILGHNGIELDEDSAAFRQLAHYCLRGLIEVHRLMADRWNGCFDSEPRDSLFTHAPRVAVAQANDSETLRSLITKFLRENGPAWKSKTTEKYRANLNVCAQVIGVDTPVAQINKASVRAVKETLGQLPPYWATVYRGKSVSETLAQAAQDGVAPMAATSINAYLASLSSFFRWAMNQGYVSANPVNGIRAVDPVRPEDKRNPFTIDQLQAMFNTPIYRGMRSHHKWKEGGNVIERDTRFWLPLVAAYTGMRLGELMNLRARHVLTLQGVRTFSIEDAKTRAGTRKIPLHPELVRMGFERHLESLQADDPVFPGFTIKAYSKFFRRFQISVGIDDPKLVFHSFRHLFADALRAAQVQEPVTKALLGHADGTTTGQYGTGYPISVLSCSLNSVNYDALDLGHISVIGN